MKKFILIFLLMALLSFLSVKNGGAQITVSGSNTKDGTYASLTKAGGVFSALNSVSQSGKTITVIITADVTSEDGANALTGAAGIWTNLTIIPSGNRIISGTTTNKPLIDLNGADYVTINGKNDGTNSMTLSNTSTASSGTATSTIRFKNDAQYNTVKNCTICGSTSGLGSTEYMAVILFSAALSGGTGNDYNIIESNNITNAGGNRPAYVLVALGNATAGQENSDNIIQNNNFYDFFNPAVSSTCIQYYTGNSGWTIKGNSFYETTSSPGFTTTAGSTSYYIINVMNGGSVSIKDNYIGGSAANCGGTWVKNGTFDNYFYAIYIRVGTSSSTVSIQGNKIKSFNWSNDAGAIQTAWHAISNYAANAGDIFIGDTTGNIIGASSGEGSIVFSAKYGTSVGTTSEFRGINIPIGTTSNKYVVKNNIIGSVTTSSLNSAYGVHIYAIYSGKSGGTVTIQNNTIGSTDAGTTNSIYASSTATTYPQSMWGIRSDGSSVTDISGNTVSKLTNNATRSGTDPSYVQGIITTGGTNTVYNNTVNGLTCSSSTTGAGYQHTVVGITQYSTNASAQTVTGNTITNLLNTNSNASFSGTVAGIYYNGPLTASTVARNFISNLSVSSTGTSGNIYGIQIYSGLTSFYNNIIGIYGNGAAAIYGIYENGTASNNNSLYFNTIYLGGLPATGTNINSYALYSNASTNVRDFRNNVFYNARSNNGAAGGKHYAVYYNYNVSTNLTANYNDYYAPNTGGTLARFNSADITTLSSLRSTIGQDLNSLNSDPGLSNPGSTTPSDYKPNESSAMCWNLRGGAYPLSAVTHDYTNSAPRNTVVTVGPEDIGAYKFSTPAPNALNTSGSIADNSTTTLTYSGTAIAAITWHSGAGTLPTSVTAKFYPGILPPGTLLNSYAYEYLQIDAEGGYLPYTYDITYFYNPARLYNISGAENDIRIAQYSNSAWNCLIANSTTNTVNKSVTVTGIETGFSAFTFTDVNSPLPVTISSFTSSVVKNDVKLKWSTTFEVNNSGFDIERKSASGKWSKVGFVSGKGTFSSLVNYSFDDKKLSVGTFQYRLKQIDINGNFEYFKLENNVIIGVPSDYELGRNYPNPFNPSTKIDFRLPVDSKVSFVVYDITGKEVDVLINNEYRKADFYTLVFNASALSSGVYIYRLIADKYVMTQKMMLIK